jgi:hypothetical protein
VQRLHGGLERLVGKERRAVAAALDKSHARDERIAFQRIERVDERLPYQAVDQQAMLVRIDIRIAGV